jgi:hypothetical protein
MVGLSGTLIGLSGTLIGLMCHLYLLIKTLSYCTFFPRSSSPTGLIHGGILVHLLKLGVFS